MSIDEIEAAALELPADQQDALIQRLQAALSEDRTSDSAWRAEVRRRMERIEAGDVEWIDEEEVLADDPKLSRDDIASAAMQIPADERAELTDRLIASLTGGRTYDPAWEAELNRRVDEIKAGTARTLSEEEFFEELRIRRARKVS